MTDEKAAGPLRFDGKVALVTGAGNGLGRAYALALAERGASVVVNDIGGDVSGAGTSARPASQVAEQIVAAGGSAVANFDDVTAVGGGDGMVSAALHAYGHLDILVNNAGVLDTSEFVTCTDEVIQRTIATHLVGSINVTRSALTPMLEQKYGRIVSTSSGAVFGSPQGVAYQSAKSGLLAFTRAISTIGREVGVLSNAILPTAFTRMTSTMPDGDFRDFMEARFTPARVAAAVLLLSHTSTAVTGEFFLVGGGRMARLFFGVTEGFIGDGPSPEDFRDHLDEIMATDGFSVPSSRIEEFESYLPKLGFGDSVARLVAADDPGDDNWGSRRS